MKSNVSRNSIEELLWKSERYIGEGESVCKVGGS